MQRSGQHLFAEEGWKWNWLARSWDMGFELKAIAVDEKSTVSNVESLSTDFMI